MLQDRTWLLIGRKMANEASEKELQELEDILKANPELNYTLHTLISTNHQNPSENYLQLDQAYAAHIARMKSLGIEAPGDDGIEHDFIPEPETRRKRNAFTLLTIAGLAIAVSVIVFLALNPHSKEKTVRPLQSEISTSNGSKTHIVLPDGTKVWLNSGSKVVYDKKFGEPKREVILAGEAYFDVKHNPEKPFIIHTRAMDIRVIGTEFNVRSYPDERTTETSLIRGSIEVTLNDRQAEKIILKPNEKLVVADESHEVPFARNNKVKATQPIISVSHLNYFSIDSTILETSWVQNRLIFEDESFEEIAKKMEHWYGFKFIFADSETARLRFTGNFSEETIRQALEAMKISAKFSYTLNNNTITITK